MNDNKSIQNGDIDISVSDVEISLPDSINNTDILLK